MQLLFFIVLASAAAAILYALLRSLIGTAKGSCLLGSVRSQGLMQKRVLYQALAILVPVVILAAERT